MIRSVKANAADNAYCTTLAHSAVHGSFAGYTNFMVGPIHSRNVQIPLALVFGKTNVVSIIDEVSIPQTKKSLNVRNSFDLRYGLGQYFQLGNLTFGPRHMLMRDVLKRHRLHLGDALLNALCKKI